jgi:hypothetical protein
MKYGYGMFKYWYGGSIDDVRKSIRECTRDKHIQQVAYSTHHDGMTQICFSCRRIRSSIFVELPEIRPELGGQSNESPDQ